MKKTLNRLIWQYMVVGVFAFALTSASAAEFVISNDDDVVLAPVYGPMEQLAARGITQAIPHLGQDGLIITSLVASSSTNLFQSRNYAMAGMFHVNVPMDRNTDPSAWHWIPSPDMQPLGWQWFDMITTTFNSWKGSTTITNAGSAGEQGHRIVVHVTGGYPVSAYTVTITSSLTNILATTFAVGTNTANTTEIPFNQNFVGGHNGANGTNESYWSTIQGQCVQMGDDHVFQNGELPSTNTYSWFLRFGSTVSIVVNSPAEMENIRKQFTTGKQWLKVELKKNGVVVVEQTIESAMPHVSLVGTTAENNKVRFTVHGGQENSPYSLESCLDLRTLDWQPYLPGNFFNSGVGFDFDVEKPLEKRFFRAVAQ